MERADFINSFVVVDRNVVAVVIAINGFLFIGFRGTLFLYDWKINLRASMIDLASILEDLWKNRYESRQRYLAK